MKLFPRMLRDHLPTLLVFLTVSLYAWYQLRTGHLVNKPTKDNYLDFVSGPLDWIELLSSIRTIGYPLYLRAHLALFGSEHGIAAVQFFTQLFAGTVFYFALIRFGLPAAGALCAVLPILLLKTFFAKIATDSLALSLVMLAVALLLFINTRPLKSSPSLWLLLGFCTAASYHMRPSYLPMILIVPILGMLLLWIRGPLDGFHIDRLLFKQKLKTYLWVAIAPFFLYCLLRLIVVGHFGLVSFGGYNLAGLTTPQLTQETLPRLSPETRPLAEAILHRLGQNPPRPEPGDDQKRQVFGYRIHPAGAYRHYNEYIWRITVPAAEHLYGADPVRVNAVLSRLSRELIMIHPGEYFRWVATGVVESLIYVSDRLILSEYTLTILLGIVIWRLYLALKTGANRFPSHGHHHLGVLIVVALTTFLPLTLLVILVEPPMDRYLRATSIFIQPLLGFFIWQIAYNGWIARRQPAVPQINPALPDKESA
ncbi:MAG: hypothetical protein HQM01_04480 [Magnetococcales bacterium]|nr:hypothetical protein [Magnetococcales bacterium]